MTRQLSSRRPDVHVFPTLPPVTKDQQSLADFAGQLFSILVAVSTSATGWWGSVFWAVYSLTLRSFFRYVKMKHSTDLFCFIILTRNTGFSQWAVCPVTWSWWTSKLPEQREVRSTKLSSHCSPALLLCVNSEGLDGLCLGSQCYFYIHFMGENIVTAFVFWTSIKIGHGSDSCILNCAEGFLWGNLSYPGGETMSQERMVRSQGSGFTRCLLTSLSSSCMMRESTPRSVADSQCLRQRRKCAQLNLAERRGASSNFKCEQLHYAIRWQLQQIAMQQEEDSVVHVLNTSMSY